MRQRGVDTTPDHVYPDLVFGIPAPPYDPGDAQTVGVGVMAYFGGNDDRGQADEIHASYVEKMKLRPVAGRQRPQGPAILGDTTVRR